MDRGGQVMSRIRLDIIPLILMGFLFFILNGCDDSLMEEIIEDVEAKYPGISVKQASVDIGLTGDTIIFPGTTLADGEGATKSDAIVFTIENKGNADLELSNLAISGNNPSEFELDESGMLLSLGPSETTSFSTYFDPISSGTRTATITLNSNDTDTGPFTFIIQGEADWWGIRTIATVGDVTSYAQFGSLEVINEKVYVCYDIPDVSDLNNSEILLSVSEDGGANWESPIVVTGGRNTYGTRYPVMAIDSNIIYVAYQLYLTGNNELWFTKSTDGGETWPAALSNIQVDSTRWDYGSYSSIEADADDIYVTHYEGYYSDGNLRFARSNDGGDTWDVSFIDETGDAGLYARTVYNNDTLYVGYHHVIDYDSGEYLFRKSTDGGDTWSAAVAIDTGVDAITTLDIAVAADTVYTSYIDRDNDDLKFARSENGGDTWDPADIVTIESAGRVGYSSSIEVDGTNIYVSYYDFRETEPGYLKFAKSTDSGSTWTTTRVDPPEGETAVNNVGWYTNLKVADDSIYIIYYDVTNGTLKLAKSIDAGETWE
jgi:hypothetical protein